MIQVTSDLAARLSPLHTFFDGFTVGILTVFSGIASDLGPSPRLPESFDYPQKLKFTAMKILSD